MPDHSYFSNLIWQIADLLRGPYRPPQYERVMLPMTVLRRFDCVLAPTKAKVLAEHERRKGGRLEGDALDTKLNEVAGQRFHNHSPLDFDKLKGDPDNIEKHLVSYIKGFSANARRIFEFFEFETEIEKMREANILYLVVSKFCDVDLHPNAVPNEQMGLIFENLIRRFNELANETAGDHFTPREVIRLMVSILFIHDDKLLATPGTVRKLLDPACGTGGMMAEAQNYLRDHHNPAKLYVYGQDYNKRAFATAASDMLMKEVSHNGGGNNVRFGDSFTDDQFENETYDYFLTNPPFGVDWKRQQKEIQQEWEKRGFEGRFGAGLPRVNDGSLLFLQHMWHKREPVRPAEHKHGSRLAIVFSGSPLFTGGAGSGESDIRNPPDNLVVSTGFAVVRPREGVLYTAFAKYALREPGFLVDVEMRSVGVSYPAINSSDLGDITIYLPTPKDQRAIATYLDRETARLDALVTAKERVLGLLAEKRRALITQAITRGLDPLDPLRDSGIPWLGKMPAHWETRRAAWLFRERDERGEADLPLLEVSINAGVVLREFSDERIESTAADFNTYKVARQGDIAFNKMRMWQGAVGVAPQNGLVSPDYVVAAPTGPLSSQYAGLLFRTDMFSAECARRSHGIVWDRLRLYWEGFREIELPLPPTEVQREIVAHVARETKKLDALHSATERTVALIKERRAALIAAAVTGGIDVVGQSSVRKSGGNNAN